MQVGLAASWRQSSASTASALRAPVWPLPAAVSASRRQRGTGASTHRIHAESGRQAVHIVRPNWQQLRDVPVARPPTCSRRRLAAAQLHRWRQQGERRQGQHGRGFNSKGGTPAIRGAHLQADEQ